VSRTGVTFRGLEPGDLEACLRLFDGNCPEYFHPGERAGYVDYLRRPTGPYAVGLLHDRLVAGYGLEESGDQALTIRWVVVAPEAQGLGLGRELMERALAAVRASGRPRLLLAASHRSAPFFARFGAIELARIPDGWGPGMHRVDMELMVQPRSRERRRGPDR